MDKDTKDRHFVPIYTICKKHKISRQNVYRWIRENKISKDDFRVEEIVVKRIRIADDVKIPIRK